MNRLGPYTGSHLRLSYGNIFMDDAMPVRNAEIKQSTLDAHKQMSFERLLVAWLMSDGWEVLVPAIDHGMKTDLVVADSNNNFYRIQVKSIRSENEHAFVQNKWKGVKIDYVVYFSLEGDWGYIAPAFKEKHKRLDAPEHIRFNKTHRDFLQAFGRI